MIRMVYWKLVNQTLKCERNAFLKNEVNLPYFESNLNFISFTRNLLLQYFSLRDSKYFQSENRWHFAKRFNSYFYRGCSALFLICFHKHSSNSRLTANPRFKLGTSSGRMQLLFKYTILN